MDRLRNFSVTQAGLVLFTISIAIAVFGYWQTHGTLDFLVILEDFYANISAELGSIAITVLIIDRLSQQREEEKSAAELKARLVREVGSPANDVALHAVRELQNHEWLRGKQGALQGADLELARLENAIMWNANLRKANFWRTNLQGAFLRDADLSGADLIDADLSAANLIGVNLKNTCIEGTKFDERTFLPDGSFWTSNDDLARFGVFTSLHDWLTWMCDQEKKPQWMGRVFRGLDCSDIESYWLDQKKNRNQF